jgi:hypothetical protein
MRRQAQAFLLIGALLLPGACAEMRQPAPLSRVPPGLGVVSADPMPVLVAEAAAAFADAGRSLAGNPASTARAVGRIEFIAAELRRDPRWAPLPAPVESELRTARLEWRAALGIRAGADADAVATLLGRAATALAAGDTRGAAALLDPAVFEPGGVVTLARLAAPGPLPQSRIASGLARDEVARLQALQIGGPVGALDPDAGLLGAPRSDLVNRGR